MPRRCCAPLCKVKQQVGGISLFSFPKNGSPHKKWTKQLGISDVPSGERHLRAKHFEPNVIRAFGSNKGQWFQLADVAVPPIFVHMHVRHMAFCHNHNYIGTSFILKESESDAGIPLARNVPTVGHEDALPSISREKHQYYLDLVEHLKHNLLLRYYKLQSKYHLSVKRFKDVLEQNRPLHKEVRRLGTRLKN